MSEELCLTFLLKAGTVPKLKSKLVWTSDMNILVFPIVYK